MHRILCTTHYARWLTDESVILRVLKSWELFQRLQMQGCLDCSLQREFLVTGGALFFAVHKVNNPDSALLDQGCREYPIELHDDGYDVLIPLLTKAAIWLLKSRSSGWEDS